MSDKQKIVEIEKIFPFLNAPEHAAYIIPPFSAEKILALF
jgi:hypothetical protein